MEIDESDESGITEALISDAEVDEAISCQINSGIEMGVFKLIVDYIGFWIIQDRDIYS